MALLGYPREHTVPRETWRRGARSLTRLGYLPSNPSVQNPSTMAEVTPACWFGSARSSGLWLQILGVERFSFLPHMQGDGGYLARQG